MRMMLKSVFLVLMLFVVSCSATRNDGPETTVKGALAYRERVALPPGAVARVTLQDISIADRPAPVLVEVVLDTRNKQVPLSFQLNVPQGSLQPGMRYSVSGSIRDRSGRLLWTTDRVNLVDPTKREVDLGVLMMVRATDMSETPMGAAWIVEDIDGKGIIDSSRASITFSSDGRISGSGSCNRYMGRYAFAGEGKVMMDSFASTEMACAKALMNQEQRFLTILQKVTSYEIDTTGGLVLKTETGETITARKGK